MAMWSMIISGPLVHYAHIYLDKIMGSSKNLEFYFKNSNLSIILNNI